MKLINVTNSYFRLVLSRLENADAHLAKVYIVGDITIIYIEAPEHNEVLLINDKRKIQSKEIEDAKNYFLDKIKDVTYHENETRVVELAGPVEVSIPKHKLGTTLIVRTNFEHSN